MRSFDRFPAFVAVNALLLVFCLSRSCSAQLASHSDAHSNSFTLKAPGLQQSFTRYFGGKGGNLLQSPTTATTAAFQTQQLRQPQQQQPIRVRLQNSSRGSASPQQTRTEEQSDYQSQYQQYMHSIRQLQQVQQELEQQRQQAQQELEMQRQPYPNPYGATTMPLSAYYAMQQQQQQQAQQQQQQEQLLAQQQYQQQLLDQLYAQPPMGNPSPGSHYSLPSSNPYTTQFNGRQNQQSWSTLPQYTSSLEQQTQQIQNQQLGQLQELYRNGAYSNLNMPPGSTVNAATMAHSAGFTNMPPMHGAHYSPASNVSRVRFSSGNLNYNF